MADITFTDGSTTISSTWLNPINEFYNSTFDGATNKTSARTAISAGDVDGGTNQGAGTGSLYINKTGSDLNFKTLTGGTDITLTNNADEVVIDAVIDSVKTSTNLGTGSAVFAQRNGDSLELKSLQAGNNISLTSDANEIWIESDTPDSVKSATNLGSETAIFAQRNGDALELKTLKAGVNVSISSDANEITIASTGGGGGSSTQVTQQIFDTAGSHTWTKPAGCQAVIMDMVGAGGGGGGSSITPNSSGGGGGGGAYARLILDVTALVDLDFDVGAGGTGGSTTSDGLDGGSSTVFDQGITVLTGGGTKGAVGTNLIGSLYSAGGTAGGSGFTLLGSNGEHNLNHIAVSRAGGNSFFGGGARSLDPGGLGEDATVPGTGGSGGMIVAAGASPGGSGADGLAIFTEFY